MSFPGVYLSSDIRHADDCKRWNEPSWKKGEFGSAIASQSGRHGWHPRRENGNKSKSRGKIIICYLKKGKRTK